MEERKKWKELPVDWLVSIFQALSKCIGGGTGRKWQALPRNSSTGGKEDGRKWEELPKDCLASIFQRLSLEDLIVGVPFVCKSWHEASLNPILWEDISLRDINLQHSPFVKRFMSEYGLKAFSFSVILKFVISRGRRSTSTLIFPNRGVSMEDWIFASKECPALRTLELPDSMGEEEEMNLPTYIAKWKDLEWLCMHKIPSTFKEILTEINYSCERFLGIKASGKISDDEVLMIATLVPKIKQLNLQRSSISKGNLMTIMEGCEELEMLDVRDCNGLVIDEEVKKKASAVETFYYGSTIPEENNKESNVDEVDIMWRGNFWHALSESYYY